jgi:hypothetical protein
MRNRLLQALPAKPSWQQAKMWCVRDKSTLEETITLLESHEQPLLPPTTTVDPATTAAVTLAKHKRQDNRGRHNGKERESKRRESRRSLYSQSRRRSRSPSHSRSRTQSRSRLPSSLRCFWCDKKGHIQQECRAYLKARDCFRMNKGKDDKSIESTGAAAQMVLYDDSSL